MVYIKKIWFYVLSRQRGVTDINQKMAITYMVRRSMPVCFSTEQYKAIEAFAKRQGMLNVSQALEHLLEKR